MGLILSDFAKKREEIIEIDRRIDQNKKESDRLLSINGELVSQRALKERELIVIKQRQVAAIEQRVVSINKRALIDQSAGIHAYMDGACIVICRSIQQEESDIKEVIWLIKRDGDDGSFYIDPSQSNIPDAGCQGYLMSKYQLIMNLLNQE